MTFHLNQNMSKRKDLQVVISLEPNEMVISWILDISRGINMHFKSKKFSLITKFALRIEPGNFV
jgi:hypothetical protein